jgi:Flp pilus assembly protein TadD
VESRHAGALIVGLALATCARNQVYRDEVTFWTDVAAKNPGNSRAFNNLGYALAGAGQPDAALAPYDRALQLTPADFKAWLNRRALCQSLGSEGRAEQCGFPLSKTLP